MNNEILLIDGVKYRLWDYDKDERNKFEPMVVEHAKDIFGKTALYFSKNKLRSLAGQGSIPDGFVIDFENKKWYIIEVELSSHSTRHIVGQMVDFMNGIDNPRTQKKIFSSLREEIKNLDYKKKAMVNHYCKDISSFLSDLIYDTYPPIVIIIDKKTKEIEESIYRVNPNAKIVEFKTFRW